MGLAATCFPETTVVVTTKATCPKSVDAALIIDVDDNESDGSRLVKLPEMSAGVDMASCPAIICADVGR